MNLRHHKIINTIKHSLSMIVPDDRRPSPPMCTIVYDSVQRIVGNNYLPARNTLYDEVVK